jgi:DNA ligase (NAD+)
VGEKIADAIIEYFADERNQQIIERLRSAGLQFEAEERAKASDTLAGLTFVISGSFANHTRDELKALIEANGGKNLAAVSANTSYLLAGDKIGPAKLQKANKLGINIISEDEFIEMIGGNDSLPTIAEVAPTKEIETKEETTIQNTPQPIQGSLF